MTSLESFIFSKICPKCGTPMVAWVRWGKDTGNLVCPNCWYKCTPAGQQIKAKRKAGYGKALKYAQRSSRK